MNIDKIVLTELQKVMVQKTDEFYDVERRRSDRERVLMAELNATLKAEFGAERNVAEAAKRNAEAAVKAEADRIRAIETAASLPYPVGTKLVEWAGWGPNAVRYKTGNVAVLEVFKKGDTIPANVRWGRPQIGSLVLRMLKKDGTPGTKVDTWYSQNKDRWSPEGVDPNVKQA